MTIEQTNVLPGELRITRTEYSTGIATTIAEAVMDQPAGTYWIVSDEARAAIAELIEALDGRAAGDPMCLARIEALSALLSCTKSPDEFVEAWKDDPTAMGECLRDCHDLVRLGRAALASVGAAP